MREETQNSDELLGAEAIDQEKERIAKEELGLAKEEEVTENAPEAEDGDEDYDEDVDPPAEEGHPQYNTLPPAEEEI